MFERVSRKRQEEGFTLIELLIVIVILGILAAVVVFAVGGISDRGKNAACKSDYKSVEVAQEAFYAKSSVTPPVYAANAGALVTAGFLKEAPSSPDYTVTTDNTGKVYTGAGTAGDPYVPNTTKCPT